MAFRLAEGYVQLSTRGFGGVFGAIDSIKRRLLSLINPLNLVGGGLAAIGTGVGVGAMLKLSAEVESLTVSFEVLTGSEEKALRLMEDINRFAASTPFEQFEIAGAAKQLLAFGVAEDRVIPQLRQIGDLAALSGARIEELVRAYGKAKGKGKVQGEVFEMFADRGIPILKELANVLGVAETEVLDLGAKGKISFAQLQQAIANMTSEGGQFYQGMEKLAGTKGGLWSTFTGNVKVAMAQVGDAIFETFNLGDLLKDAASFAENFRANFGDRIRGVFTSIRDFAAQVWPAVANFLRAVWEQAVALGGVFGDLLGRLTGGASVGNAIAVVFQKLATAIQWVTQNIRWLWENYGDLITRIVAATAVMFGIIGVIEIATAAVTALGTAIALLTSPIGIAIAALTALSYLFFDSFGEMTATVAAFVRDWDIYLKIAWEGWKLWLSNMWERIKTSFINMGRVVVWFFTNFLDIAKTAFTNLGTGFANVGHNIKEVWKDAWAFIRDTDYTPDYRSITDGMKTVFKDLPEFARAAVRESTPELDKLNRELIRRQNARNKVTPTTQAEKAAAALGGGGGGGGGGAPAAAAGPAASLIKAGQYGYDELARNMQDAAFKQMEGKNDAAERGAKAMQDLNQQAKGEGIAVRPGNGGRGQNVIMGAGVPAWG